MKSLIKSKTTYLIIIILGFLFFTSRSMQLAYSDFALITPSGRTESFNFPAFVQSNESGVYKLNGIIEMGEHSSTMVRIIPDDEILALSINKKPVNFDNISDQERRDYSKGFIYDLEPYLHIGKNEVEIIYTDSGGLMGVVIGAVGDPSFNRILYGLLFLIGVLLAYKFIKVSNLKTSIKILFLGALFIRIIYFTVTPPDVRDHDLGDHAGYIEYLTTHWVPPPLDYAVGGAFFHPPLYYYTGAIVYKVAQIFEPANKFAIYRIEQILSLIYSMGFVLFGLLILEKLINALEQKNSPLKIYRPFRISSNRTQINTKGSSQQKFRSLCSNPSEKSSYSISHTKATPCQFKSVSAKQWCTRISADGLFWVIGALFAFWPVAIIHSVRIGNDPMEYFLFTASLYYMDRWYRDDKKRDLMIASLMGAAAIVTKANGEILVAVLAVIGLYKMIKSKQYIAYLKLSIIPFSILFTAVAITVAPGLILMLQGKRDKLYIDNIDGLSHANLVGNTAANYLWFDAKIFVTEPFADPYDDRMGRQFFWNYLGKTGLFGEFKYPNLLCINTAVFSSLLEIFMLIYVMFGIYYMTKDDFKRQAVTLLSGFFLWAGITYMRMTFPANIDFRYIVPILITFCALYATSIINFQKRGAIRLAGIGMAMAALFTLSGILFIFGVFING